MGSREQSKEILATNPLYCPSQRRAKTTLMEENPWGGKCPNFSSHPCRALLWMPPRCHRSPPTSGCPFCMRQKRTKREKKVLDMEIQDKVDATKGEEVTTSTPSRAREKAQPEARRKQLESSQKMDWREYPYLRNNC